MGNAIPSNDYLAGCAKAGNPCARKSSPTTEEHADAEPMQAPAVVADHNLPPVEMDTIPSPDINQQPAEPEKPAETEAAPVDTQQLDTEPESVAQSSAEAEEYKKLLDERRKRMIEEDIKESIAQKNIYGAVNNSLPPYEKGKHIPTLALINPRSGAKAGSSVLGLARKCDVYKDRFFDIIKTCQSTERGGLLDLFRWELNLAKEEARSLKARPRVISGGGDGTGSFTLHMIFKALQADNSRAKDGLGDKGNGFIWTDEEMAESFPAIAQMPLGSANDFANIIGWGQKFPGSSCLPCCSSAKSRLRSLYRWMEAVIDPATRISNFDVWGIMPRQPLVQAAPEAQEADGDPAASGSKPAAKCNFKLCELDGKPGRNPKKKVDGKQQLTMKEAGPPTPFFILLYFSTGFGGYLCSRFSINRKKTPLRNRMEYTRQIIGMITERCPPQLNLRANGVRIDCTGLHGDGVDDHAESYFPPRRGKKTKGSRYREVGFYNINWQAHLVHGADRADLLRRCCFSKHRRPVKFNDGLMDMYRMRFKSYLKNPGKKMQTDKKRDMNLSFQGDPGKGIFVQYDGEARFVFSPTGERFNIFIRKVLNIPVVIGPFCKESLTGNLKEQPPVTFEISGDKPEAKERVRVRILKSLSGEYDKELNATAEEIKAAKIPLFREPVKPKAEPIAPPPPVISEEQRVLVPEPAAPRVAQ